MKNNTLVLYIHGKGGTAEESEHYKSLFSHCDVVGFDYKAETPWEAKAEFPVAFETLTTEYSRVILIANSIGAYFSMCALPQEKIEKAYFISPIVDMKKLIGNMMNWANVNEDELREKGTIETAFGETLSWNYLCYVHSHPICWNVPTEILYGGQDNLTCLETITAFADIHGARLTVMENGEHWFHTAEQMQFLDNWITARILKTERLFLRAWRESDAESELGYWLGKPFWGRSYMPEAAIAILRHAFEDIGMTKVWCGYYDGNEKSKRVQEKLGFVHHHTCDSVPVPLMNEVRIGHTNMMTKEIWLSIGRNKYENS